MKVLGIDTSTSCGSVGLVDDGKVISDYLLDSSLTHSERLLEAIEFVLKEARFSMKDLDGWAISLGPGSFTGLRIGVSTVKGLALATQRPVVGLSTLDVLASQIPLTPYLICLMIDARKKEVYTAFYRYDEHHLLKKLTEDHAIRPQDLICQIKEKTLFVGDGVKKYGDDLRENLPALALYPPPLLHLPHGSTLAKLGLEHLKRGEHLDLSGFTPVYVRPSDAELKWREKRSI